MSPAPHVPAMVLPNGASQIGADAPAPSSILFKRPSEKKAIEWPSGDQKREVAPSVPGSGRASSSDIARTQIFTLGATPDTISRALAPRSPRNARREPSGERAKPMA